MLFLLFLILILSNNLKTVLLILNYNNTENCEIQFVLSMKYISLDKIYKTSLQSGKQEYAPVWGRA